MSELIAFGTELRAAGWSLAGAAVFITGAVRLWRLPPVQDFLKEAAITAPFLAALVWQALPQWLKWVIPFVVAFAGALLSALGLGVAWPTALVGALVAAVGSIATHHGTKAAGRVASPVTSRLPAPLRHVASIALPIKPPPGVEISNGWAPR